MNNINQLSKQSTCIKEWKIHEYVEIYKKQSRKKVERNILVVNTPARTDRSDGPYLQKTRPGADLG